MEGSGDIMIKQELKFEYKTINNQAEYEPLIADMILNLEIDIYKSESTKPKNHKS